MINKYVAHSNKDYRHLNINKAIEAKKEESDRFFFQIILSIFGIGIVIFLIGFFLTCEQQLM